MSQDQGDQQQLEVREKTKREVADEILARAYDFWRTTCLSEVPGILYEGQSQSTANAIGVGHMQGHPGHQCVVDHVTN